MILQSAERLLSLQIDPDERLLWSGRPQQGLRLQQSDLLTIPFSLMWGGFAIFWELTALKDVAPTQAPETLLLPLWGIPFVMFGLYFMFGRFFVDARSRERTFYGVTNQRIIILSGFFSQQTKSLQLRTLADLTLSERNDGRGTITFGLTTTSTSCWHDDRHSTAPSFDSIEGAKEVYEVIRGAQKTA